MLLGRSEGGTFHYSGCGCIGAVPLPLPGLVDEGVARLRESCKARRKLRVIYLLPHHNLTGGMKMLVQQMRVLIARGHHVVAAYRNPIPEGAVLPPWCTLHLSEEMRIPPTETYEQFLRRQRGCFDVCMVGYFTQLGELDNFWGPLLYWEQGHEHLFGEGREPALVQWDALFHHTMMRSHIALAAVSEYAADTLALQFGRRCAIIPNAIDCSVYFPPADSPAHESHAPPWEAKESAVASGSFRWEDGFRILLVGNPSQSFKGWDVILQTLNLVHHEVPRLQVTWICQVHAYVLLSAGCCAHAEW